MNRYRSSKPNYSKLKGNVKNDEGIAFAQEGGGESGKKKSVKCWHCDGDHYKSECPELKGIEEGFDHLNVEDESEELSDGLQFFQREETKVNPHFLCLDKCTNFHSASNKEHLSTLRSVRVGGLRSQCNAGTTQKNERKF